MRWRRRKSALFLALQVLSLPRHNRATVLRGGVLGQKDRCALYGAHCRCVSGLGEARIAMLQVFLHLRMYCKRLPHQAAGWPKHCRRAVCFGRTQFKSGKVEARPLQIMPIVKSVLRGRKGTTKWNRELIFLRCWFWNS